MKTADVRAIFDELKRQLLPLIREIADAGEVDSSFLHGSFDPEAQRAFSMRVLRCFGFSDDEWRLDTTGHPFMCTPGQHDVRITTNFRADDLTSLFATMHEFGHGVYEWGVAPELHRTPLASGVSLAVHESQSRSWENLVGRSRPFWRHFYPQLQEAFPQLGSVDEEAFYRAAIEAEQHAAQWRTGQDADTQERQPRPPVLPHGDLAAQDGPAAVTVLSVTERLGAPSGSFYYRFASRDLLLAELWLTTALAFQQGFVAAIKAGDGLSAALHTPRWVRGHLDDARLFLLYHRDDFVLGEWPEALRRAVAAQTAQSRDGVALFARLAFGHDTPADLRRAQFLLAEVPLAAVGQHLRRRQRPPRIVDALIRVTFDAVVQNATSPGHR